MAFAAGQRALSPAATTTPPNLRLRVEYSGCATVLAGPVCVLSKERVVRLWIQAPAGATLRFFADERALQPTSLLPVQGGVRHALTIPTPSAQRLIVEARSGAARGTWRLRLRAPEQVPALERALAARKAGKLNEARQTLERALPRLAPGQRGQALGQLARIAMSAGDTPLAKRRFGEALALLGRSGRVHDEVVDATVLVYLLIFRERSFGEARRLLDGLTDRTSGFADTEVFLAYFRGLLASNTGDLRSALRQMRAAVRGAERLEVERLRRYAEQVLAGLLGRVGRGREADALYARLWRSLPRGASACDRAMLLNNRGWAQIRALEAGASWAPNPTRLFERAVALYKQGCKQLPDDLLSTRLNLALAQLHGGAVGQAEQVVARLTAGGRVLSPRIKLWERDITARIALERGRPRQALATYDELAGLARAAVSPEARWRAATGRARALEALGRAQQAQQAYTAAEALQRDTLLQVALGDGRATYAALGRVATRRHVALLLRSGQTREAMDVARRARTQALRSLGRGDRLAHLASAQRARHDKQVAAYWRARKALEQQIAQTWQLPADQLPAARQRAQQQQRALRRLLDSIRSALAEGTGGEQEQQALALPPLAPGEVTLLLFSAGPRRWLGFAADEEEVVARELGQLERTPTALAQQLLTPFAPQIQRNQRVRVLPAGAPGQIDLHALPWRGGALIEAKEVVYGLDLPPLSSASSAAAAVAAARKALVVADPGGDLPHARAEARQVRAALARMSAPWQTQTLIGAEVRPAALRRALGRVDLFHFAGHATSRGVAGYNSTLRLADDTAFWLGDVLTLPRVPKVVVLLGCNTGQSAPAEAESLGLARAFLLAGSRAVVAATRPLDDAMAARFSAALYREQGAEPGSPAAFRQALLRVRAAQTKKTDWASLRLFVP